MKKSILYSMLCLIVITVCGCSFIKKENSSSSAEDTANNAENNSQISRIEAYYLSDPDEVKVIKDKDIINNVNKIIDNAKVLNESDKDLTNLQEKLCLDFYKKSVTVIKSEDPKIYSIISYENTNIIINRPTVENMNLPSNITEDELDILYEITDKDMEYLNSLFD